MKIGKIWLICIILWWIESGVKNPDPPGYALFSSLHFFGSPWKGKNQIIYIYSWGPVYMEVWNPRVGDLTRLPVFEK